MPGQSSNRATAKSATTSKSINSSVLRTAFAPANLNVSLFASTIKAIESEKLQVHNVATGEFKSNFTLFNTRINCIRWGLLGHDLVDDTQSKGSKKRKLNSSQAVDTSNQTIVIAVCSGVPEIQLFSPLESRVITSLRDSHARGTRDFAFEDTKRAWSLGKDSSLIYWDLLSASKLRTLQSPADSLTRAIIYHPDSLLLASQSVYLHDTDSLETRAIPCFDEPIHSIISQPTIENKVFTSFLAAAESKSTIGVYSTDTLTITGNLNAGYGVRTITLATDAKDGTSLLASVSETGIVELFDNPFQDWSLPGDDLKTKRRKMTRRSNATIEVRRSDASAGIIPVMDAVFNSDGDLVLAVVDGSLNVGFEVVSDLRKDGILTVDGTKVIRRAYSAPLANQSMNGVKDLRHAHVDEARVVLSEANLDADMNEDNTLDNDGMLSSENDSEDDELAEDDPKQSTELVKTNGAPTSDTEMIDPENEEPQTTEEPTFGELIKARGINTVKVSELDRPLAAASGGQLSTSTSNLTLGTLVTQALNTNDSAALDMCLAQQDVQVVRATIERLDSSLALTLLQRLAERLHSRPGRAGSLLAWVQWTVIAHGGYLASRPDVVKQLQALRKVVQQRAQSLQPLLALKGKLDMLDAQITLRKRLQQNQTTARTGSSRLEHMIYVEGQSESESEDEVEQQALLEAGPVAEGDEDSEDEEAAADAAQRAEDEEESEDEDAEEEYSDSDLSDDDRLDDEANHDDMDGTDSDGSVDDVPAVARRQINGTKPH